MRIHKYLRRLWLAIALLCIVAPGVEAAAISQEYQSVDPLSVGMLVSGVSGKPNTGVAADTQNSDSLIGVVVPDKSATLMVGTPNSGYQVATQGVATVYVTDIAGLVKVGDQITASPLKGIGMKATSNSKVVGTAQSDATKGGQTAVLSGPDGKEVTAHITSIRVNVAPGEYNQTSVAQRSPVSAFLQIFANNVAGKPVALARVILSTVLVVVALSICGIMLLTGVRTTMSSLGRNPLARQSIYKGLWQVSITAIVIMVIALTGAYVVLVR